MPSTVAMYSASGMRGMPEFVEMALGPLAMGRAFSDAGLPEHTQMREGAHIPEAALVAFLDSAARQSGDAALGALLGTHVDIRRFGS